VRGIIFIIYSPFVLYDNYRVLRVLDFNSRCRYDGRQANKFEFIGNINSSRKQVFVLWHLLHM